MQMKATPRLRPMGTRFAAVLATVAGLVACNDHPVQPLDSVVTAVNRQENRLPAKTKLDFLFLVDNSGSMCEEQRNLTANFQAFSEFLFDELGAAADYRIAVTTTDLHPDDGEKGRFVAEPAPAVPSLNCQDQATGEALAPDTADCQELLDNGDLPVVIQSGPDGNIGRNCANAADPQACARDDLERKFRCLATLGTQGDGFEKGLEALRLSLSCDGPNRALFEQCCDGGRYNPACVIPEGNQEPTFLRPDAILVVVIVSDEDDCSDPASNPAASKRAICKYGAVDSDGDGVPDGYRDQEICGNRSAQECYSAECGNLDPETCRMQRCVISRSQNSNCEWFRSDLTPVQDYYRFLTSLKAQPLEQILFAAIVGKRAFTEQGFEVTYNQGLPGDVDPTCEGLRFDPNQPVPDRCCPQGRCLGTIQSSCRSGNGDAFAGRRYLQLAEAFEDSREGSGIGCPADADQSNEDVCVNICVNNFQRPLQKIKEQVAKLIANYCLDKPPACVVPAGAGGASHRCETAAERNDAANYNIRVRQQCLRTIDQGGLCQDIEAAQYLARTEWNLVLNQASCAGGAAIQLASPPPAGAEVFVEFLVELSRGQGAGPVVDASVGGGDAPAGDAAVGP